MIMNLLLKSIIIFLFMFATNAMAIEPSYIDTLPTISDFKKACQTNKRTEALNEIGMECGGCGWLPSGTSWLGAPPSTLPVCLPFGVLALPSKLPVWLPSSPVGWVGSPMGRVGFPAVRSPPPRAPVWLPSGADAALEVTALASQRGRLVSR